MVSTRSQKRKTRSGKTLSSTREGRVNKTLTTPRRGRSKIPTAKQVENALNGVNNNAATPAQMNNLITEVASNNVNLANNLKKAANKLNKPVNRPPNRTVLRKLRKTLTAPPDDLKRLRVRIAKRLGAVEPNRNVRMGVLKRVNKKISELRRIVNKAEAGNTWLRRRAAAKRRTTPGKYTLEYLNTFRIGKKRCMHYSKAQLMNFANTTNKKMTKAQLCKIIKEKNAAPQATVVTPKIANKNRTCQRMKLAQLKNIAGANANTIAGRVTKRKLCEVINAKNMANNRGGKRRATRN